jgi:hypothetical protein
MVAKEFDDLEPTAVGAVVSARWKVIGRLAEGGMGVLYLAHDERNNNRRVVLKFPKKSLLYERGFRERFERETRSLLEFEHPHLVRVYDTGMHGNWPYVVLQYLPGGNLAERVRERPQKPMDLTWLPQVAAALDAVHKKGIIHRDVKAANILFGVHGEAYLSDFGIIKIAASLERESTLTQGGVLGSADSFAPECIDLSSSQITPAYDQFGLAMAVYRALAGRQPFEPQPTMKHLLRIATEHPRPLDQVAAVSASIASVVSKAMSLKPGNRFASCGEFASAFDAAMRSRTELVTPLRSGELVVSVQPAGAQIYIDGVLRGVAPLTIRGIEADRAFTLRAVLAEHVDGELRVQVQAGQSLPVTLSLRRGAAPIVDDDRTILRPELQPEPIRTPRAEAILPERQGQPWLAEEQKQLYERFVEGMKAAECAALHQRSRGGIRAMLRRLGLLDERGHAVDPIPPFSVHRRATTRRTTAPEEGRGEGASKELWDTIPVDASTSGRDAPSGIEIAEHLRELLANLVDKHTKTPRNAEIVKQRLGLGEEGEIPTLSELGGLVGLSRERVRQLEKKGVGRIYLQLRKSEVYSAGVLRNLSHFGSALDGQVAADRFIKFLREQIPSQAARIRWGTLAYGVLAKGKLSYKQSELLFLKDYRAHFEALDAEWEERKRLWQATKDASKIQRWSEELLSEIFWPESLEGRPFDDTAITPMREPNDRSLGDTTSFWSNKNARMVMAESDMERVTYDILEAMPEAISYIEQPLQLGYEDQGKMRTYCPDIFVRLQRGRRALVEVKDKYGMVLRLTLTKALAAKKWAHERGIGFGFFSPRGFSHTKFYKTALDGSWAQAVLKKLDEQGSLRWDDMRELLRARPEVPSDHILALVVQNDLALSLRPYCLSRLPEGISFQSFIRSS